LQTSRHLRFTNYFSINTLETKKTQSHNNTKKQKIISQKFNIHSQKKKSLSTHQANTCPLSATTTAAWSRGTTTNTHSPTLSSSYRAHLHPRHLRPHLRRPLHTHHLHNGLSPPLLAALLLHVRLSELHPVRGRHSNRLHPHPHHHREVRRPLPPVQVKDVTQMLEDLLLWNLSVGPGCLAAHCHLHGTHRSRWLQPDGPQCVQYERDMVAAVY